MIVDYLRRIGSEEAARWTTWLVNNKAVSCVSLNEREEEKNYDYVVVDEEHNQKKKEKEKKRVQIELNQNRQIFIYGTKVKEEIKSKNFILGKEKRPKSKSKVCVS